MCGICKNPTLDYRCKPCKKLYQRVYHRKNKLDSGGTKVWKSTAKDRIADFIRSTKGFPITELKDRMRQFVSNEFMSQLTNLLTLFLDSADLQSKYNDKPEQLEAFREHAIWMITFLTNPDEGM